MEPVKISMFYLWLRAFNDPVNSRNVAAPPPQEGREEFSADADKGGAEDQPARHSDDHARRHIPLRSTLRNVFSSDPTTSALCAHIDNQISRSTVAPVL